jgi:hypothetical protein
MESSHVVSGITRAARPMTERLVALHVIGQGPRADLTARLEDRFRALRFVVRGALDGVAAVDIPDCEPTGYPLETQLRDGTRVVVDAESLEPLLQAGIDELDDRVKAHLLLCAGSFAGLTAHARLIRPFEATAAEVGRRGFRCLDLIVPFSAQKAAVEHKWESVGYTCHTHVLSEKRDGVSLQAWLATRLGPSSADAVVIDYVGFSRDVLAEINNSTALPVIDMDTIIDEEITRVAKGSARASW